MSDSQMSRIKDRRPFDCLVLSGGGAKGAFGAGAARAVLAYRALRKRGPADICFLGTSSGALNAAVLAAWADDGPSRLNALWSKVDAMNVLGGTPGKKRTLCRLVWRAIKPSDNFSVFDADSLRAVVRGALDKLNFEEFQKRAHLIIVATDYSAGRLARFYSSSLLDRFIAKDIEEAKLANNARPKLNRFKRITSMDMLVDCLLASAAIPLLFPLVPMDGHWYGDGGIGNNTPVQEAALLMRALNEWSDDLCAADTFCVFQHPSNTANRVEKRGLLEIAAATYDLVHELHLGPILGSWLQINASLVEHERNLREFVDAMERMSIAQKDKEALRELCREHLSRLGGHAPRLVLPLHEIRPSGDLGGVLAFDAPQSHDAEGYTATVDTLFNKQLIQPHQKDTLQASLLNGLGGGGAFGVSGTTAIKEGAGGR